MLYKYSFSILCGHLNLNQKRKKFEFGGLPVKPTGYQSNRPINRSNRPVYQYEPFAQKILNSNLTSTGLDRFPAKPVRYTGTKPSLFGRTGRQRKPCVTFALRFFHPRCSWVFNRLHSVMTCTASSLQLHWPARLQLIDGP